MKKLVLLYNYCIYRLKAVNEHGVHSPFVFDLLTNVIYNRADYYSFKSIETIREQFLKSKTTKEVVKSAKYDQLLFRLVNHFEPSQIIELRTGAGIACAYMASANSKINVVIIEDRNEIAEIARNNFKKLKLKNIELINNAIDDSLPRILKKNQDFYFIYFNENKSKQSTLNYFNQCLEKANDASVFVFNSIYQSDEMKEAWITIKNNSRVTVTIDLFFLGIIFFRKEQAKQHFVIKF